MQDLQKQADDGAGEKDEQKNSEEEREVDLNTQQEPAIPSPEEGAGNAFNINEEHLRQLIALLFFLHSLMFGSRGNC
jgi:hypothetical protein